MWPFSPTHVNKVILTDKNSELVDEYFCSTVAETTLSRTHAVNDLVVSVTSATGLAPYQCLSITENGHFMQSLIISIDGTDVTLSAPLDRAFTSAAKVAAGSYNMNVNGSVTKQYFSITPPAGAIWHINRIIVGMTDDAAMDDGKFGGITALANGVILRKKNGVYDNIFQVSDNSGWRERSFDIAYADKAPAGVYGFGCRKSFNGPDKSGATIRLVGDDNDTLEFIIQDNLTGLIKFACVAQGHSEEV